MTRRMGFYNQNDIPFLLLFHIKKLAECEERGADPARGAAQGPNPELQSALKTRPKCNDRSSDAGRASDRGLSSWRRRCRPRTRSWRS